MNPKAAALFCTFVAVIAAIISTVTGFSFVWIAVVVASALIINGLVATVEDDLPGGFNNPDGTDTPSYIAKLSIAVRGFILLSTGLLVFVLVIILLK